MTIHAYTSFSYSYLNRARILAATLRRQHPDWIIWAVITDTEPAGFTFDLAGEDFDRLLTAEELFRGIHEPWLFRHDVIEACTAVKGRALMHIMAEPDADKVFYFDPDIAVFGSMNDVVEALDTVSIVLTPHQVTPDETAAAVRDNEITSLHYGVFNLGFVAVSADEEGRAFAKWWTDRLHDFCLDRLDIGLFVDQKWCNLVPCYFDRYKILRDPGYNVASWNLSHRRISTTPEGELVVNKTAPLRFFHFSKHGTVGDIMIQRYAKDNTEVYELWFWYRQQVIAYTDMRIPKGWWFYGRFEDGTVIPKPVRELYRDRVDLQRAFPQPRSDEFRDWLRHHGFLPAHEPAAA